MNSNKDLENLSKRMEREHYLDNDRLVNSFMVSRFCN